MNYESTARVDVSELLLTDGQTLLFTDFPSAEPCSVAVYPEAGATVYVSLSFSLPSRIKAGTCRFTAAGIGEVGVAPDGQPAGIVTATDGLVLDGPATALRFVCIGGSAAVEVVQ